MFVLQAFKCIAHPAGFQSTIRKHAWQNIGRRREGGTKANAKLDENIRRTRVCPTCFKFHSCANSISDAPNFSELWRRNVSFPHGKFLEYFLAASTAHYIIKESQIPFETLHRRSRNTRTSSCTEKWTVFFSQIFGYCNNQERVWPVRPGFVVYTGALQASTALECPKRLTSVGTKCV